MTLVLLTATALAGPPHGVFRVDEAWSDVVDRHGDAVDGAVRAVPSLLRPLVRPRLARSVWSCDGWTLSVDETWLSVQCRGREPLVARRDGTPLAVRLEDGRRVTLTGRAEGAALVLDAEGTHGSQECRWELESPDTLVVTRTIRSRWLPVAAEWTVRYARDADRP